MKRVDEILRAAQALTEDERRELLNRLGQPPAASRPKTRSILELDGLGADIWREVDADAHVCTERDSWDSAKT